MKFKKICLSLMIISLVPILSSCGLFNREEEEFDNNVDIINNIEDMEDGSYYVKKSDKEYQRPYVGNLNYQRENNEIPDVNPIYVAWFGQDFNKIPTMHKGEKMVYKSSAPFGEKIMIQRYFDLGYTMGISGLHKSDDSDRYFFSVGEDTHYINPDSSAGAILKEFNEAEVLLESIGDTPLKSGNVTEAGTVKGLEKGKTYSNYMYVGTQLKKFNIVADVKCLSAAEYDEITDYRYTKSKTIEFTFPKYYNSGYYFIGGFGFVRYIDSDKKFDEKMDMNIPNDYPKKDEEGNKIKEENAEYIKANDISKTSLYVDHDQKAKVIVTIDKEDKEDKYTVNPTIKLIGPDRAYTLDKDDKNTYVGKFDLQKGAYNLQIIGLNGRAFKYRIEDQEKETSIDGSGSGTTTKINQIPKNDKKNKNETKKDSKDDDKKETMADIVNKK